MMKRLLSILILLSLFVCCSQIFAAEKKAKKEVKTTVEIQTRDNVILTGTLTVPANATVQNKVPVVLLFHSLGGNRNVYDKLSNDLKNKNIATLAIDLRGHGQSTTRLSGKKTYWQNYSNKIYQKYVTDVQDVTLYLKDNYVALNPNRIGIVAADVSANAAIIATGKIGKQVPTMVLFTPTLSFKGLTPAQHLMYYGNHPVMIIAAKNDVNNYTQAQILSKYASNPSFITVPKGGTGDAILKTDSALNGSIVAWFVKNL